MVDRVLEDVKTGQQLAISFTPAALASLSEFCLRDLSNGGRVIRNQVEVHLVNPLARALFALDPKPGARISITSLTHERGITALTLSH